jgi:phosphoglycerate-specific signal transduction histidine kinase
MTLYLTSSILYKNLLKYSVNKNEIKEEFNKKIKELNFKNIDEVNYFLNNYKNISYDKNNLIKYIKLLRFFKYNITKKCY